MKVIVLDGNDGVGKSYLADKLVNKLKALHLNVIPAKFPDASLSSGKDIYKWLNYQDPNLTLDRFNPFATWMKYAINRYEWFITQGNLDNAIIVADRYTTTSAAYQAATLVQKLFDVKKGISVEKISDFDITYMGGYTYSEFVRAFDMKTMFDGDTSDFFSKIFKDTASMISMINFMMFFEYNILRIPAPDIVFHIKANKSDRDKALGERDSTDVFENDDLADLRDHIYYVIGQQYKFHTIQNSFSYNGVDEINWIMDVLTSTEEFGFIKYLD